MYQDKGINDSVKSTGLTYGMTTEYRPGKWGDLTTCCAANVVDVSYGNSRHKNRRWKGKEKGKGKGKGSATESDRGRDRDREYGSEAVRPWVERS